MTTFVEAPTAIEVTIPADTQPIGAVAGIEVSPSLHAHLTEAVVRIAGPSYNLDEGLGYLVLLADEYEPLRRAAEADAARSRSYAEVTAA